MVRELTVHTPGMGMHEFTPELARLVTGMARGAGLDEGLCTVFIRHTSASLTIQENTDPSAKHDLERWIERFVPENQPEFTHTAEGPDDMPSHIKAALTATSLSIPVVGSRLTLGTWQGVYVWEHRRAGHARRLAVHLGA